MIKSFLTTLRGVSSGGTNEDLIEEIRKGGDTVCLQGVFTANLTSPNTKVTIGIVKNDEYVWLETIPLTVQATYYKFDSVIFFPSDFRVIARFTSTSSGDVLAVNVFGYIKE